MYDVVTLGELLIDFTPSGKSEAGMRLFEQNPGGAVANAISAIAKLGRKTAFVGKVGNDMHGIFLKETLDAVGVDTTGLLLDADSFTTLAFVTLSDTGERSFAFARKPGADTRLTVEEVRQDTIAKKLLEDTKIFHFGSLSLTNEPSRGATLEAVKQAKAAGAIISYDPNYRALLWSDAQTASVQMKSVLPYVDILKISDEETILMTGESDPEKASALLVEQGIPVVVVTLGKDGALVRTKDGFEVVTGYKAQVVDTTGAGDSFWGGYLFQVLENGKRPEEFVLADAVQAGKFANAVASLCVEKRGGIPAMPSLQEVQGRMQ